MKSIVQTHVGGRAEQTEIEIRRSAVVPRREGAPSATTACATCATCTTCGVAVEGRPFCPSDGALTDGPFEVGQRYLVEESLGMGGNAFVFGASHRVLGKPVALKILRDELARDPGCARRFLREAQLASQLQHENIVSVMDFGQDEALGIHYLVMERLRGPNLAEVLRAEGAMPWRRAVPILMQLARALGAAHGQKVIHRDINPRNIILEVSSGRRDVVKLCDFGISRLAEGDERVTVTGEIVGTPAYMAPEQVRGEEQDGRVDIYAFGVAAYEVLTGALPHEGKSPVALLVNKLHETALPPGAANAAVALPPTLEELIMRCIAREPNRRPKNAAELERVLTPLLKGDGDEEVAIEIIGTMVGSHRVTSLLGAGGVGTVYRAEHPIIGTEVAIKVLHPETAATPEAVDRFVEEARASSAIGSPHIPKYTDFGRLPDGRPYAVMECFMGEDLQTYIHRKGPLSLEETASLLDPAAEGIAAAHDAGIIHRDLKPENLFLARDKNGEVTVKVLDFGIAKVRSGSPSRTLVGYFMGTPAYCAPEQITNEVVGPATDVYALGATAFEMLTGRTPFEGSVEDVFAAKRQGRVPRIRTHRPDLPAHAEETLERMLAQDPKERTPNMAEVRVALASWHPASATPSEQTVALPTQPRRRLWTAMALAAACACVGAWWFAAGGPVTEAGISGASTAPTEVGPVPEQADVPAESPGETPATPPALPLGVQVPAVTEAVTESESAAESAAAPPASRAGTGRQARANPRRDRPRAERSGRSKAPRPAHRRSRSNDAIIADPFE